MEELAKQCSGFTCSALETLVNECIIRSDENNFVSRQLIIERILEINFEDIPRKTSALSDTIDACRNIGYFIVARSLNSGEYMLNLEDNNLCNNFFNKIMSEYDDDYEDDDYEEDFESDDEETEYADDNNEYFSKTDMLNTVCVLCGGYAVEQLVFNKIYDNMQCFMININTILIQMFENGMFGIENAFSSWRNGKLPYSGEYIERVNGIFEKTISDCYKTAEKIITINKELVEKLIPILVEKRYMDNKVCEPILNELGGIKF